MVIARVLAALLLMSAAPGWAQKYYVYVGDLGPTHALIAWGTTERRNTIGRSSPSLGKAELKIGGRAIVEEARNWTPVTDLLPGHPYDYEVLARRPPHRRRPLPHLGREGRTGWNFSSSGITGTAIPPSGAWPMPCGGSSSGGESSGSPVRFVLTTGDNIYGDLNLGYVWRGRATRTALGIQVLPPVRDMSEPGTLLSDPGQPRRQRQREPRRPGRLPGQLLLSPAAWRPAGTNSVMAGWRIFSRWIHRQHRERPPAPLLWPQRGAVRVARRRALPRFARALEDRLFPPSAV